MASPFRLFRKYMKPMMVVLCGMAMLAFVVVDPLMQYLATSSRGGAVGQDGSKVVVTWNDGELTEDELNALIVRRRMLNAFVRSVYEAGYVAAYQEGAEDLQLAVEPLVLPVEPTQGVERDVVYTQIIADDARRLGMAISDEAARDYLDKLGRNRVTFQQMNEMLSQMFSQQRITSQFILDALRDELLKQNFLASYKFSLATLLPEQRWHDWLQVNDRVIVEAVGLKTSDFLAEVKEPTDAEVLAFYDKYKNDEVTPEFPYQTELPSGKPGFRVPRHVRLQYLEANYEDVLQELMATVTDEEIAKYYEENKKLFLKADSGAAAEGSPAPGAEPAPPAESPDGATPPEDSTKELFGTPSDTPPAENPPEADAENPPAEEPAKPTEEPAPPSGPQSSRETAQPFKLVAFQDEPAPAEPAAEQPATETPIEPAESPKPESVPSESAPTSEPPPADPAAATPPAASEAADAEAPPEKVVEYQPLEEVREEIRRQLAGEKVNQQIREKMDSLLSKLNTAYLPYFDKQLSARADKQPEPEPPAELKDLEALAAPNGLQYHDTGDLSVWELRKLPLAQTIDADDSADPRLPLLILVLQRFKNYEPFVTRDLLGNRYLVMKTADIPGHVPKLEEVRDQVVQAWKEQKASELALAKAKELAKEVEKDGVTLGEKFANDPAVQVVVTDPFSFFTYGDISPSTETISFRLSDPKPIVAAGPEFMETVFQLEDGKLGAVLNHNRTIAYIVRLQEHLEDRAALERNFLQEMANGWPGANTMARSHAQFAGGALINGLMEEAGIQWERAADQPVAEESDER